MQCFEIFDL